MYNPFLADERILLKAAQIFTSLVPRPLMQYTQLSLVEDHGKGTNFSLPVAQALLIYITTDQARVSACSAQLSHVKSCRLKLRNDII